MKALSIRQPWAAFIAAGPKVKSVEIRSWPTKHRGDLLVVSSMKFESDAEVYGGYDLRKVSDRKRCADKHGITEWRLGQTVCVVDLVDVRPFKYQDVRASHSPDAYCDECEGPGDEGCKYCLGDGHVFEDQFAWVLENPRSVRGEPIKGRLGLYEVSDRIIVSD